MTDMRVSDHMKKDGGKPRWDLYPWDAAAGTVGVLGFGAAKYKDRGWEAGMDWSRLFASLQRHMLAFWSGENTDPESGLPHLDHAACCIAFLQAYQKRGMTQFDDRPDLQTPQRDPMELFLRNVEMLHTGGMV